MKNCVIVMGVDIIYDESFLHYIQSHVKSKFNIIDSFIYIEDYKNFNNDITAYSKIFDNILIFSSSKYFSIISKVLASTMNDDLLLKGDILVPSLSTIVGKKGFVISHNGININLVLANKFEQLPDIQIFSKISNRSFHIFGIPKDEIELLIKPLSQIHSVNFIIVSQIDDWYKVLLDDNHIGSIDAFIKSAKELFGAKIIDNDNIFEYIIKKFDANFKKISFAESCTGGLIASSFVKNSGVSSIFDIGIVSYSNDVKNRWLDVDDKDLMSVGAVSSEVVTSMAKNILIKSNSDYSIAVSGIAGPDGGSNEKPVGTVYIAVGSKDGDTIVKKKNFNGNREYIQQQTLYCAINTLVKLAIKNKDL
jgi:nicotinamide-nucleotide amidase